MNKSLNNSRSYGSRPGKLAKRNPVNDKVLGAADSRRRLWIKHYLINLSVKEASDAVGITERQGSKYLKKPEMQLEIQQQMEARSKRLDITCDYVLETIRDTVERCRSLKPVRTRDGDPILVSVAGHGEAMALVEFDAMAVLKGCELLGKHLKMFTEKFVLDLDDIENMTDQQLAILAGRIRKALMKNVIESDPSEASSVSAQLTEGVKDV